MPYCQKCGTTLPDDEEARFCPNCGASIQAPSRIAKPIEFSRKIRTERSRRTGSIIVAIAICFIITAFGAILPIDSSEAQGTSQEFVKLENVFEKVSPFFRMTMIYGNNLMHSLVTFIPFVGPLYGSYVLFSTGRFIAAVASTHGTNAFNLLILTFIFPHAWIEYASFGIALSEGSWLTLMILRRSLGDELTNVSKAISACALLLLSAAFIETYLIFLFLA